MNEPEMFRILYTFGCLLFVTHLSHHNSRHLDQIPCPSRIQDKEYLLMKESGNTEDIFGRFASPYCRKPVEIAAENANLKEIPR